MGALQRKDCKWEIKYFRENEVFKHIINSLKSCQMPFTYPQFKKGTMVTTTALLK